MPTPYESATLNLKLFEMRREPVLREAREWFLLEFNPESFAELAELATSHNSEFRMVLSYWEMACSLVTSKAIDDEAFLAAHNEIVATFAKIHPFLAELRAESGEPEFCQHIEAVVLSTADAMEAMERRRGTIRAAAKARRVANDTLANEAA
jgi:hypothetical protein